VNKLVCFGLAVLALACTRPDNRGPRRSVEEDEAVALIARFVAADTAGDAATASALFLPLGGDTPFCELAADGYYVTRSARVFALEGGRDSVAVVVQYAVVGNGWSEDSSVVGEQYWRFRLAPREETDTLLVTRDSTGKAGIACGPRVPPNHLGFLAWERVVPGLDGASAAAWRIAAGR